MVDAELHEEVGVCGARLLERRHVGPARRGRTSMTMALHRPACRPEGHPRPDREEVRPAGARRSEAARVMYTLGQVADCQSPCSIGGRRAGVATRACMIARAREPGSCPTSVTTSAVPAAWRKTSRRPRHTPGPAVRRLDKGDDVPALVLVQREQGAAEEREEPPVQSAPMPTFRSASCTPLSRSSSPCATRNVSATRAPGLWAARGAARTSRPIPERAARAAPSRPGPPAPEHAVVQKTLSSRRRPVGPRSARVDAERRNSAYPSSPSTRWRHSTSRFSRWSSSASIGAMSLRVCCKMNSRISRSHTHAAGPPSTRSWW